MIQCPPLMKRYHKYSHISQNISFASRLSVAPGTPLPQAYEVMEKGQLNNLMDHSPLILSPESSLKEAAGLMLKTKADALPVVDRNEYLLGVIRLRDILRMLARS